MTLTVHGQPGRVRWLRSPWDERLHAFPEEKIGEMVAEALCEHSAPTGRLSEQDGGRCFLCQLLHGDDLADRHEEQGRWLGS